MRQRESRPDETRGRRRGRFLPIRTSILAAFALGLACAGETPTGPWNVVLVSIDTLRADRLGLYGYFRDTSPEIDRLARESIVFTQCLAPIATTYPSHLSLLTATYPLDHGSLGNVGDGGRRFRPTERIRSLAGILREHGYATAAFVSAAPLKPYTGINAGFDVFDAPAREQRRGDETNEGVFRWLEEKAGGDPFFLWVHYFDPHSPFRPPEPFASRFEPDEEMDEYLEERAFNSDPSRRYRDSPNLSVVQANNLYDGEVRYVDQQIGELLKRLRSDHAAWRRTIVVVVGDHGEGLGQHDEMSHGTVWTEQLHVPLVMRVPGEEGRRVETPISVTDVVPTLAGLVDLPGVGAYLRKADGIDRLRAGAPGNVFSLESGSGHIRQQRDLDELKTVLYRNGWKYVHDPLGEGRLFDLGEDPFELHSVRSEHPDVASEMKGLVEQFVAHQGRRRTPADSAGTIDPEALEELRALGYVD